MLPWKDRTAATAAIIFLVFATTSCTPAQPSEVLGPSSMGAAIACGSGFGAPTENSGPGVEKPIWSAAWTTGSPDPKPSITLNDGSTWVSAKAVTAVLAHTSGTITVTHPKTAKLLISTSADWGQADGKLLVRRSPVETVELPDCANSDTYPGLILSPEPLCVSLSIHAQDSRSYDVHVPVGVSKECP